MSFLKHTEGHINYIEDYTECKFFSSANLIILSYILSPEILEVQCEFPIQVLNFLFQDSAGGLLEKRIFQPGDGQEINGGNEIANNG